jgi:Raf kinase inhibitor-like YbhB/YbcL family protein
VVDDPDAPGGTFHHWGIYNLAGDVRSLAEGQADRFAAAVNDYGTRDYRGPRPPHGHGPHRYRFRLAALDVPRLDLPPTTKVADLGRAIAPHRIAEATLTGTYER